MPVPTTIADLNVTASLNSPAGSEAIGTSLDDYIRAHGAIIKQHEADLASTAAGKGAALLGWLRSAASAVATTVAARLGWFEPCPFEFMSAAAVLDAQTDAATIDSRAAIAATDTAGPFVFYKGTYKVSSNITISNAVEFRPGAKLSIDTGVVVTFNGAVTAGKWQIFSGLGTVVIGKLIERAYPEWWGASASGTSGAAINKMISACSTNRAPVHFSQEYSIETKISIPNSLPVTSDMGALFNASGGATEGIEISDGNGGLQVLPSVAGFTSYGLKLKGTDLANVQLHAINNCGDGLLLDTTTAAGGNLLDSKVFIDTIGGCTNAIRVVADNAANVMQGNEVHVNFIVTSVKAVFFDANGLSPNWDSNAFYIEAIDPTTATANSRGLTSNATDVSRLTFHCRSWFGGFAASGVYINGGFNGLDALLGLAEAPEAYTKMALVGAGNKVVTRSAANANTTPVVAANAANSRAAFNGGVPLILDKMKIRVTLSGDVLSGGIYNAFIYSMKTDIFSEAFNLIPLSMNGMYATIISDQSGTNANEIWIQLVNGLNTTIAAGTNIDFYFEIGL